jgi:hypothetical protein
MKIRDYVFWTFLTLTSVTLGSWLRSPSAASVPGPISPASYRSPGLVERATYWLAIARLAHGGPQPVPVNTQELPDEVVNAPALRAFDVEGTPLLAHGAGW